MAVKASSGWSSAWRVVRVLHFPYTELYCPILHWVMQGDVGIFRPGQLTPNSILLVAREHKSYCNERKNLIYSLDQGSIDPQLIALLDCIEVIRQQNYKCLIKLQNFKQWSQKCHTKKC